MTILDRAAIGDRQAAQRDVRVRLEQIRDDVEDLLDDSTEPSVDEIEGVIFGVADSDFAEIRATQEPGGSPPPALLRILGEYLDGLGQVGGRDPAEYAAYALRMMDESKASGEYEQTASQSRRSR